MREVAVVIVKRGVIVIGAAGEVVVVIAVREVATAITATVTVIVTAITAVAKFLGYQSGSRDSDRSRSVVLFTRLEDVSVGREPLLSRFGALLPSNQLVNTVHIHTFGDKKLSLHLVQQPVELLETLPDSPEVV